MTAKEMKEAAKREDAINKVLSRFDFKRVHKAMCAVEWEWGGRHEADRGVPSIREMRSTACGLLFDVLKRGQGFSATGGFTARIDGGELVLTFELEEAAWEPGDEE